jgi:hypothetical protein
MHTQTHPYVRTHARTRTTFLAGPRILPKVLAAKPVSVCSLGPSWALLFFPDLSSKHPIFKQGVLLLKGKLFLGRNTLNVIMTQMDI